MCRLTIAIVLLVICASARSASLSRRRGALRISNDHYQIELDTAEGLGWKELANLAAAVPAPQTFLRCAKPARVFELTVSAPDGSDPVRLDSRDFRVKSLRVRPRLGQCEISLEPEDESAPIELVLRIAADDSCQTRWAWTLRSDEDARAYFVFPILEGLAPGDRVEDVGYFFPRDPGLMNNVPIRLLTNYGQYATAQLVSVFNEQWGPGGGGVYYTWQDTSLHRKSFELVKADPDGPEPVELLDRFGFPFWDGLEVERGVGVASALPNITLPAGEAVELPPLALGIHAGIWRQAFRDYQAWVSTWYEPRHPAALARFFTFASYHAPDCPFWKPDTAEEAIAGIPEKTDQLHFIAQKQDRYGVYDTYREDWGLDGLRQFIAEAQARGKLCSHYFQGQLAHSESPVYLEHGAEWGLKNQDGTNAVAFANNCMCYAADGWRQWLADTTARAVRDLGLDIVYLDCVGWTTAEKFVCHNPNHAHPPEYHRLTTVRDLFSAVKEAIRQEKPDVALTTEGPVADLFFSEVDGNEGYGVLFLQDAAYGPPMHFMRFLYPRFKYLDLRTTSAEMVKQALFNATATDADPRALPEARIAHRVFHENVETFTRGAAEPHLPTREPAVYCNRFTSESKTVYTVWNDNPYRAAGACVPVNVPPGCHIVDVIRHREALTGRVSHREHLVVDIPSRDVAVFAVLGNTLRAHLDGMWLCIDWSRVPEGAELSAVRIAGADEEADSVPLSRSAGEIDLVGLSDRGRYRVALKLLEDGLLLDEMELPELGSIDIAASAEVTCSNPHVEHGARPQSVVDQDGEWRFAWDDEPRPGWLQLAWQRPQTFSRVEMSFQRSEYSSRHCEVQTSEDGEAWRTLARGTSDEITAQTFSPVATRFLRVVFHEGGRWANLVALTRLRVAYTPAEPSTSTPEHDR